MKKAFSDLHKQQRKSTLSDFLETLLINFLSNIFLTQIVTLCIRGYLLDNSINNMCWSKHFIKGSLIYHKEVKCRVDPL